MKKNPSPNKKMLHTDSELSNNSEEEELFELVNYHILGKRINHVVFHLQVIVVLFLLSVLNLLLLERNNNVPVNSLNAPDAGALYYLISSSNRYFNSNFR